MPVFESAGYGAIHWSSVGSPRASDREVLAWAQERRQVVFTHDLDFGAILAATDAAAPSVIQIRTQDPTPDHCRGMVINCLKQHAAALEAGSLVTVDESWSRVRLLPLGPRE